MLAAPRHGSSGDRPAVRRENCQKSSYNLYLRRIRRSWPDTPGALELADGLCRELAGQVWTRGTGGRGGGASGPCGSLFQPGRRVGGTFESDLLVRETAAVTGASCGIGQAVAPTFAAHGADVARAPRSVDALEALADELVAAYGVGAPAVETDVPDPDFPPARRPSTGRVPPLPGGQDPDPLGRPDPDRLGLLARQRGPDDGGRRLGRRRPRDAVLAAVAAAGPGL